MSSLKYFQHISFEAQVIEEDEMYFILKSKDDKDLTKYLIHKKVDRGISLHQKVKISAVPILSEYGIELLDVKFK